MSLFAQYTLEKDGKRTEESDYGFITYMVHDDNVHVDILYVAPQFRELGIGTKLFKELLEKIDVKSATAVVDTAQNGPTYPLRGFLNYGFKVVGTRGTEILLYKDLNNG